MMAVLSQILFQTLFVSFFGVVSSRSLTSVNCVAVSPLQVSFDQLEGVWHRQHPDNCDQIGHISQDPCDELHLAVIFPLSGK